MRRLGGVGGDPDGGGSMRLLIVSGTSGSGKSSALNLLEDLGAYCVDNLPVALLSRFARQLLADPEKYGGLAAVGIDVRNPQEELARFPAILAGLREAGLQSEVIFLDAEDSVLLKRFSETRRKHPLTRTGLSLAEAIAEERRLLDPIAAEADLHLDTTQTSLHQLRELVRVRFQAWGPGRGGLRLRRALSSQSVLGQRLARPHRARRPGAPISGHATGGGTHVARHPPVSGHLAAPVRGRQSQLSHCTGGQHRSVYLVERLREHFQAQGREVLVRHRELS